MRYGKWVAGWLWFLNASLLLIGCGENDLTFAPPRSPQSFEELKKEVSRIRGLPFVRHISLETKNLDEIQSLLTEPLEDKAGNKLIQGTEVYKRLGLFSESTDVAKALLDLRLFKEAIRYDAQRRKLLAPQEPLKPALAFLRFPWSVSEETAKQILLIHALTHALAEQHFHWQEKIKNSNTIDEELALRALMHGDAVLVALDYFTGNGEDKKRKMVDGATKLFRLAPRLDKELARLPELFRQILAFEYLHGSQFALWAYSRREWEGVNALFSDPPLSTAQILHPDRYYTKRADPLQITPWRLIRLFGAKKVLEETLGEFMVRQLLRQALSEEETARAASGWSGDSLLGFRQGEGLIVGWVTAWASPDDAQEFFAGYRKVLEKRYAVVLVTSPAGSNSLLITRENSPPLLLQVRGNFVFFLDGVAAPRSIEIAQGLWEDLETRTEPLRIPFDVAGRTQRSFPVRK